MAPEAAFQDQLSRRGLLVHFLAGFGAGTAKEVALQRVSGLHPNEVTVFFGGSLGDGNAVRQACVAFVAVINE